MKSIVNKLNKTAFIVCLTASLAIGIASFLVPPMGVIDPSVLKFISLLLGFLTVATVMSAINRGADITVTKGDTSVTLDNPEQ